MKTIMTSIAAGSLLAALAMAQTQRFSVTDLGAVGPAGQPFVITNNGLVSGAAAFPDNTLHSVLWYKGRKLDIGTPGLKGPNSMAIGVNQWGQVAGEAQTLSPDPKGEDFCGFAALGLPSSSTTCLPFLWQNGVMYPLPTLGGNNGAANQINNRGEVAGMAENTHRTRPAHPPVLKSFSSSPSSGKMARSRNSPRIPATRMEAPWRSTTTARLPADRATAQPSARLA